MNVFQNKQSSCKLMQMYIYPESYRGVSFIIYAVLDNLSSIAHFRYIKSVLLHLEAVKL
jgi:hypothetical protein